MTIFFGKSVRRWATLLVVLTVTAASLLQIADIKPAFASYSNTYPWGSAPCAASGSNLGKTSGTGYWCSGYNWGESPCPSGDGFCTTSWLMNGYYLLDQWGEGFRNCVSYTAWQLKQIFNVDITSSNPSGWGNGKDWNNSALAAHYSDDTSPQIGDIAQWDATQQNTFGHVAYVYNVVNGVASYAEYNYAQDGAYLDTYTSATQGAPTHYIHIGTVSPPHSDTIIKVQKTIEPDGTQQLYTATSSDVWQTWWNSNSGTTPLIYISQNNIADVVEFDAGGGVQDLFTATNTGVWETNWGNGQNPSSSNIIANLSNVKKILFHAETVSGVTTYQIYLMTNTGVKQYWWNANSNGIQSGTIYSVSNPVAMAFGNSPSGVDEIFTATAGAVEESSFAGGGITNTQIIGISQNNIAAIDKLNSSGGTQILSTATTTGDWDSNWTTGSPSYTQIVNNFNGAIAVKRRFDPAGNNQLYLANGGTVEQYWWGSSGSGAASLITISQNNISTIDEDQNGSYEQLYTGAGHIAYETYWGPTNGTGQIINTDTQIGNGNVL